MIHYIGRISHVQPKVVLFFLTLAATFGCANLTTFYLSRPVASRGSIVLTKNGIVEIDDLKLLLRPTNHVLLDVGTAITPFPFPPFVPFQIGKETKVSHLETYTYMSSYYGEPYLHNPNFFYIEIVTSSQQDISFNPKETYLRINGGNKIQASNYFPPSTVSKNAKGWPTDRLCENRTSKETDLSNWYIVAMGKEQCFAIKFNVSPPRPNTTFTLEINGVRRGTQLLTIPPIDFFTEKVRVTSP